MVTTEIDRESVLWNVVATISAALTPGTMLPLPVLGAIPLPRAVSLPSSLLGPPALLLPAACLLLAALRDNVGPMLRALLSPLLSVLLLLPLCWPGFLLLFLSVLWLLPLRWPGLLLLLLSVLWLLPLHWASLLLFWFWLLFVWLLRNGVTTKPKPRDHIDKSES
jgi:hypothetical protein